MGEKADPLYDDETMRLMSEAYESADKDVGTTDKALQVTMALAIIRAINDGERDREQLSAAALSAVNVASEPEAEQPQKRPLRPGWVNLSALFGRPVAGDEAGAQMDNASTQQSS